jgi:CubicO group peptidase (beta-lactamase class C family)
VLELSASAEGGTPGSPVTPAAPSDVARAVVRAGVAPAAAAGWAARGADGLWEVSVGGATDALFDLASLTKPMTALAIARSGLDRATPVGRLLEETRGTPVEGASIELLLAHRAGLEAHVKLYERGRVAIGEALRTAASSRRPEVTGELGPEGAPPVYSDLGYLLAGEALARHVGARDAGEAIEALIAAPLGLRDELGTARALEARLGGELAARATPTEDVAWRGGILRGVVHDENAWVVSGTGGSGHAGMFGTVSATLAFARAAHDAIVRGDGPLAVRDGADLGWMIRERPGGALRAGFDGKSAEGSSAGERASARTFGHLGFTGTSLWIDPDAAAAVVLLTNRVHPTRENALIRAARPEAHDALWAQAAAALGRR